MHTQNDGQYTVLINCLREQRLASGQTQQQLARSSASISHMSANTSSASASWIS